MEEQSRFIKIIIGLVIGGVLIGGLYLAGADGNTLLNFSIWVAAVIGLMSLFFWAGGSLLSRGRSSLILRGLSRHGQGNGDPMSAEEEQATKDIKNKFIEGLDVLKKNKVNLYNLPWYLVIGESGVGKTEAIRRGRIDLIHGLHDPGQGKGGTRDMHWWFTANAVLLDTAGRMVFPEHKSNSTPAWCRFLDLLKRYRSHCPINGILLMVSAESLLRDDEQEIFKKATKISKELYAIRDVLDLRFPIYVLITKCDRVPGFNEFFAKMDNCDQIIGWSNPDEDFHPDTLTAKLGETMTAFKKRRAVLLRDRSFDSFGDEDNAAENPESWYALPNEMEKTLPNLEKYMRTIFPEEGAFAGKRPFMRGVYFTSAMREGAPLDMEIAKKFSIDVDELPVTAGATDEGASFFLRDLFKEKIFLEKGMVTPETNTRNLLWKRKAITLGFSYLCLTAVAVAAFWGIHTLKKSIADQKGYWVEAAKENHRTDADLWQPTIVYKEGDNYYSGENTPLVINGQETTLVDFHSRLHALSQSPIELPPVLKPISRFTQLEVDNESERQIAQRILFENGVLHPLYNATRDKMISGNSPWDSTYENALVALIRIEGALEEKALGGQPRIGSFPNDLSAMMHFLTGQPAQPQLTKTFEATYSTSPEAETAWPPASLSAGKHLDANEALLAAVNRLVDKAQLNGETQRAHLTRIKQLSSIIKVFEETEKRLLETIGQPKAFLAFRDYMERVNAVFETYELTKEKLDVALQDPALESLKTRDWFFLKKAYDSQIEAFKNDSIGELTALLKKFDQQLGNTASGISGSLAVDLKNKLSAQKEMLEEDIDSLLTFREISELERYDRQFLTAYLDSDDTVYQHRYKLFTLCYYKIINSEKPWSALIGNLPNELRKIKSSYLDSSNRIARSQDSSLSNFQRSLASAVDHLEHVRMHSISSAYIDEAQGEIKQRLAFPIILDYTGKTLGRSDVLEIRGLIMAIRKDIQEGIVELFARDDRDAFDAFNTHLNTIESMVETFFDEEGNVRTCKISVPEFYEHKKMLNEHFLAESNGLPFPGDIWKIIQLNSDIPVRSDQPQMLGAPTLNASEFSFQFYRFPKDIAENNIGASKTIEKSWAPLRHIYDERAFPSSDYKTWDVPIWINLDEDVRQPFFVRFKFDKALPQSKDDWPTLLSLGMK